MQTTHQYCRHKVAENDCAAIVPGVRKSIQRSKKYADCVESDDQREELPARTSKPFDSDIVEQPL